MIKKELKSGEVYIILILCLLLIAGCVSINISLVYGFAISIILSSFYFLKKGYTAGELTAMMIKGLAECRLLYVLILLIGAAVSIWLCSGVVPSMIYYGFEYMKGMNFLLAAFLIVAVSAVFMGTAVGTVSTVGIAILGIGRGFGIPVPVLLGAVVSGAFIADKISPISGLLNLTLASTKTNYRGALKSMLITLVPTIIITCAAYYFLGNSYRISSNTEKILEFQAAIKSSFYISPYQLLMPVLIVIMSILGVKIIYSILTGLLSGIVISIIMQKITVIQTIRFIFLGYKGNTGSAALNHILISGGVVSMLQVVMIVMGAIALSSILEGTGLIVFITDRIISKISSSRELIINTALISGMLTVVTCDQTIGIVLPGRLLRNKYKELHCSDNILARTISDSGTIIAPLMPWNVNSMIITLVTGVSAGYAPYAVLCYVSPLITLAVACLSHKSMGCGLKQKKLDTAVENGNN